MNKTLLLTLTLVAALTAGLAGAQPYENSSVVGQVQDRLLVTFKSGVNLELDKSAVTPRVGVPALDALAARYAVRDLEPLYGELTKGLKAASRERLDRVWTVDFDPRFGLAEVEAAYAARPEVERVERVDICKMYDAYLPNDPKLSSQWYLRNMTMGGGDVRAVGAWNESLGDSNIVICILDSGVDWHHPDLGGPHDDKVNGAVLTNWPEYFGTPGVDDDHNGFIDDIRGWDFVDLSPSQGWPDEDVRTPDNDPMDYGSHGTQCAGAAAGLTNNGLGIAGVAPGCKILAVRCGWMPNGSAQGVVRMDFASQGILYALGRGANIINCSWGSTSTLAVPVSAFQNAGGLIITAAGNDNTDSDPSQGVPSWLSTAPGVISVAATGSGDGKASFSNFGDWVEISAPGVGIYTTTYLAGTDAHTYSSVQGTSFSSPITCGAAALIWSALPNLTAVQVASRLYNSADDLDAINPGYAGQLGAGRVNLLKALGDNIHHFPTEFPTLHDALNSSSPGDTVAITGSELVTGPLTIPGRGIKVFGGYSDDFSSRDPLGNPTEITGQINNHTLRFLGAADNSTEVDGFRLTGGGGLTFSGIPYTATYGGGVMLNAASPTLRNIEITGNMVGNNSDLGCGGGLAMTGSAPVLENVRIHGNTAIYGAGLFAYNSTPTLINCVIEDNLSIATNLGFEATGGGIYAVDSDLTLVDCAIRGHSEQSAGGGIYAIGVSAQSTLDLTGGEISGNSAHGQGGGLYIDGGALTAKRVLFNANTKTPASTFMNGGALYATNAAVSLDSLTLTNNTATVGGGAALNGNTQASLTNSLLANNEAQFWGGGLAYEGNGAGDIVGNTIVANSCLTGGAGLYVNTASPTITNNISAFNTGGATYANGMALLSAPSDLACNDVFGNEGAAYSGQADPTGSNGNLAVDPEFCDVDNGQFGIAAGSPCGAAASDCGLIGAYAAGCSNVATTLSTVEAAWLEGSAQLSWQARTQGDDPAPRFRVAGVSSHAPGVEWDVPVIDLGSGFFRAEDSAIAAPAGSAVTYRLYLAVTTDSWLLVEEIELGTLPGFRGIRQLNVHPNPFNPETTIAFTLGAAQQTRISIYSPDGRRVTVLSDELRPAGPQTQVWNGRDAQGKAVGSGLYFVMIEGDSARETQKLTLLK